MAFKAAGSTLPLRCQVAGAAMYRSQRRSGAMDDPTRVVKVGDPLVGASGFGLVWLRVIKVG